MAGVAFHAISIVVPSNPDFELYDLVRKGLIVFGAVIILIGIGLIVRALTWKTDNSLAEATGNELAQYLDERYTFIRNISKLAIGYVDAVLVGPPGVLVFRILDNEGVYFNEGVDWLIQKEKGEWATVDLDPTREAVADIKKIREYLTKSGLKNIPVFGVVVFLNDPPLLQFSTQEALVPVSYLSEISFSLNDNYFAKDRMDPQFVRDVVRLLYA